MGTIRGGILGGFRKKAGAVIGFYWRSLDVIKGLPRISGKAATAAQLDQRTKFGLGTNFLSYVKDLIEIGYKALSDVDTPMNVAVSYRDALDNYNEAINLVLEDKETPNSQEWLSALYSAGNLAGKMTYKRDDASGLAQKYWNLAMGSRGETLDEKISFLKDYGVKDLIIYHSYAYTIPYVIGGCSPTTTKYLLWVKGEKTYVQKFNNCETFKPLVIDKSDLAAFYPNQKDSSTVPVSGQKSSVLRLNQYIPGCSLS